MDGPDVHPQVEAVAAEIASMEVRGATTIAETAAHALRVQAQESDVADPDTFRAQLRQAGQTLVETRPTAVSLPNAVRTVLSEMDGDSVDSLRESVVSAASALCDRLDTAQADLGAIGAERLTDGDTILTHCHSTAVLACVETAVDRGIDLSAYVKETRPRLQGHITAGALADLGVDATLIVDGAAHRYLADTDHVLVGADSIAPDGSVVNKIGTSGLAVLAEERGVPLTVAAGTIKLHPGIRTGADAQIEHRDSTEVLSDADRAAIGDVEVANPAFDVTDPEYVDAIVTERGVLTPDEVRELVDTLYAEAPLDPWSTEGSDPPLSSGGR
ncbi:ribose 1,5-bisphosphate isomerase [Halobacteriales archaeon Cl-PHB]